MCMVQILVYSRKLWLLNKYSRQRFMMKNFRRILLVGFLLTVGKIYAQPAWSVNPSSYNYSMTLTGVINLNYTEEQDVNNMVGAFVGGVCRGVAQPVFDAQVNRYVVYLLVYSNASTETVDFQVYDASTGATVVIPKTMTFEVNKIAGTAEAPYIWSDPTLSSDADILNFSFTGQLSSSVVNSTTIDVVMPQGTDLTALVATYTTTPYAVVNVNSTVQTSGTTPNDFTNAVIYNVVAADETAQTTYTVNVSIANGIPSDINISNNSLPEGSELNTVVGTLSTTDFNTSDTHTYTLVSGTGDTDNSSFIISGTSLLLNVILDYEKKSVYYIRLKTEDSNGGYFEKEFTIIVVDQVNESKIQMLEQYFRAVNLFTPNGDGVNDFWEIENAPLYTDCEFIIFNNIGEKVFNTTGYNNNWNGTSTKGDLLPVGTYYYTVISPNCKNCSTVGFISILR